MVLGITGLAAQFKNIGICGLGHKLFAVEGFGSAGTRRSEEPDSLHGGLPGSGQNNKGSVYYRDLKNYQYYFGGSLFEV